MIVVGTTLAAFAMEDPGLWGSWLHNHEQIRASRPDVTYFAALELDARGAAPFMPLVEAMTGIGYQWTFRLDDGRTDVHTHNRIRHITMGQQLVTEYATEKGASHMLFMAADCAPPADALTKLLEVDHPLVAGHVPTYCLGNDRHRVDGYPPEWDVRAQPFTAAFVLVRRDLFKPMKWRGDPDLGMTDDPAYEHDARRYHGVEALTRRDCIGRHYPESISAIETRFPNIDMTVYR